MKPGRELSSEGLEVGMDPRKMDPEALQALGHVRKPVLQAIRERCVDCCGGSTQEVRLCVAVACVAWPFRMGTDPWRAKRTLSESEKNLLADRLKKGREAKAQ
jgi:hypothetical protein